ncbi:hypothetical protein [Iodobacter fluviatilis]|uniref:Uncharacterized protein n=1 Tax=Iodobacter fluviatilis TaxID=537 RepID=A0A7G3G879_9NEIS|nr:hypothetical protein [Iodobacter fluviatilis]QBC43670.1 hypothetical protein C1H71_09010 [Iodobacter fluviatilis]
MNIQLKNTKHTPINKIVIVGHPLSGYQDVEALLNSGGMNAALPSRRDGFLPAEISMALCKAHHVPRFELMNSPAEIKQIETAALWHGMALDLFLGNIDQEFWGWADPQSVYLLNYWQSLDPQIAFILVYDTPQQLISQAFDEQTQLSTEALEKTIHGWCAYNAALLHFYHRNTERCLLVHSQQVRESTAACLQQVRTRIGAPVQTVSECGRVSHIIDVTTNDEIARQQQTSLKTYIAQALMHDQPDSMQLYEELQSVANLPLVDTPSKPASPLDAWLAMTAMQSQHTEQITQVEVKCQEQAAHIQQLNQQISSSKIQLNEKQQGIAQLQLSLASDQKQVQEQQKENALLLAHLHQVQEELERQFLADQQQKIKALQVSETLATERKKDIDKLSLEKAKLAEEYKKEVAQRKKDKEQHAAELIAQNTQLKNQLAAELTAQSTQLKKQLAAEQATIQASALNKQLTTQSAQENELLLRQLHQVQEELERYFHENQKLKHPVAPPKPSYYGAADRIKTQLSYKLGATMISQSSSLSGLLTLPWALIKQVREYRANHQANIKLPPIQQYSDAHEAERVKQHLSYRLGTVLLSSARSPLGWLKMPWVMHGEIRQFKLSRSSK